MLRRLVPVALVALVACGGGDEPTTPVDDVLDVRIEPPSPGPQYLDFVTPEFTFQPGEEKQFCIYKQYTGEDVAFVQQESFQGKFGHHVILLGARNDKPDGTVEDCTDAKSMANFDAFTIPGPRQLDGHASLLPSGKRMVIQMHYVNAGKKPVKVRDAVRLHLVPKDSVKVWASTYAASLFHFDIKPRAEGGVTFDCLTSRDQELTIVGGHMHEQGKSFKIEYGPDAEHLQELYSVPNWVPDYRDHPPIKMWQETPIKLPKGTVIRTTCEWRNTLDHAISFPEEMCAVFGMVNGFQAAEYCADSEGKTDAKPINITSK